MRFNQKINNALFCGFASIHRIKVAYNKSVKMINNFSISLQVFWTYILFSTLQL
jgi:hypothetical protein